MKELKFRQAITDTDGTFHWHYWGYLHTDTAGLPVFINPLGPVEWDKRPSYQQTGLKDKNDKEIYVGHKYKWYQPLVEDGKQIQKEHISVVTDDIVELYYLHNRAENCWGGVEIIGE